MLTPGRLTPEGVEMGGQLYAKHKDELKWPENLDSCFGTRRNASVASQNPSNIVQALMMSNLDDDDVIHQEPSRNGTPAFVRTDSMTQRFFIEEVVMLLDNRELKNKSERFVPLFLFLYFFRVALTILDLFFMKN